MKLEKIEIRQEQKSDYRETEEMVREAFWNHYSPGCAEHYLVHVLRDSSVFLPELNLVAVSDGRIVGNAMCIKGLIRRDDGGQTEVLSLGPLSVLPEYQRKGVGTALIEETKKRAAALGYGALFLCGDPDYYTAKGFAAAEMYGIRTADNMYAVALHACELYRGALEETHGRYYEDSVYEIDEIKAEQYDKKFPPKEKVSGTPTQQKFDRIVAMRRPPENG